MFPSSQGGGEQIVGLGRPAIGYTGQAQKIHDQKSGNNPGGHSKI